MVSFDVKNARRVLFYYALGLLLTVIFHFVTGWKMKVMLPKSVLGFIIILIGAMPWLLLNVIGFACPVHGRQNRTELLIHCVVFVISAFIIFNMKFFIH